MAIDQTWSNPSTGEAIDLNAGDQLTAVTWDKVMSNIKRIGGTAGPPNTQETRGAFPVSGYVMGALAHDMHVEGGTVDVTNANDRSGFAAVAFANAYAAAPFVVATCQELTDSPWFITDLTGNGFNLHSYAANTNVYTFHWIAIGSDV
jgi:hypothetical protein